MEEMMEKNRGDEKTKSNIKKEKKRKQVKTEDKDTQIQRQAMEKWVNFDKEISKMRGDMSGEKQERKRSQVGEKVERINEKSKVDEGSSRKKSKLSEGPQSKTQPVNKDNKHTSEKSKHVQVMKSSANRHGNMKVKSNIKSEKIENIKKSSKQAGAEAEVSTPLEIRDLRFEIRD